jgi:hypothetical protein
MLLSASFAPTLMDLKDDEQVKRLTDLIKDETDSQKLMELVAQLTDLLDTRYGPKRRREIRE